MSEQPSMQDILKAVENMQSSMQETQEKLSSTKVTGTSSNKGLTIELTGKFRCTDITLPTDFQSLTQEDLGTLIQEAVNSAVDQVEELTRNQIKSLSADLDQKNES